MPVFKASFTPRRFGKTSTKPRWATILSKEIHFGKIMQSHGCPSTVHLAVYSVNVYFLFIFLSGYVSNLQTTVKRQKLDFEWLRTCTFLLLMLTASHRNTTNLDNVITKPYLHCPFVRSSTKWGVFWG